MPETHQDISWQWIQEALPSIELNKVIFLSLFSNASCWSYIVCSPSFENWRCFDIRRFVWPMSTSLSWLFAFLDKAMLDDNVQEIFQLSNTLATPMQSQCNLLSLEAFRELLVSGSYCRRCHQGHGYIRIKNTCAFVCVAEEQTFCKHLKPSSMGQIRQRDNLLYNPGSPMHYAGSPRAAARPREPERWSEEQRRGVQLPQPRESCLQHWYLKEILLK